MTSRRPWLRILAVPVALALAVSACTTHAGSYETARLTGLSRSGGRRLRVMIRGGRVVQAPGGSPIWAADPGLVEIASGESVGLTVESDADGVVDAGELAPQQAVEAGRPTVVWLVGAGAGTYTVEFFPPEMCLLHVCVG